jgi:DNA-binding MarR family transcriptional regulator
VLKQFRIIFRSVKKHFQVIERKCGIGGSQLWALGTVCANPGIRVSDLARTLSVHQSTASNLVEQMVRLGLIVRERDEDDQRVVRLNATARGATLIARAPQPLTGVLPDALSHLASEDLENLHRALDRLLGVMQVRDEGATHTPLADI